MNEIIRKNSEFYNQVGIEINPTIKLRIKVIGLSNREFYHSNYFFLKKERKFISKIKEGDIITIEYPISFIQRSSTTCKSSQIKITIEESLEYGEIRSSHLDNFWDIFTEFEIIE